MKFGLIICTFERATALLRVLDSVKAQAVYPNQILIIDGSLTHNTKEALQAYSIPNLDYYYVQEKHRGLTRQRNFGIAKLSSELDIAFFLDDDVDLVSDYFENILDTYKNYPDALGVGGYILDDSINWQKAENGPVLYDEYEFDGWKRKLGSRNVLRKKLNLLSDCAPGIMPAFSNGFSIGFLPPSGKTYSVEFFIGCAMSFRISKVKNIKFSNYFEGYGLYEDMEYCLRVSKLGQLYVNTSARLYHYHDPDGRPNQFRYGKMVIENGWHVWRTKYEKPSLKARLKWYKIAYLLTFVRLSNVFSTSKRQEAFTEFLGRMRALLATPFKH
ncbi:glycosyltransferase family 2 protein [Zunongwangia sp. HRR-M8]|uniref:glycosyltransferase family 2 protein n=1 Tax=Zunongwangia sp. HRR-M8 TaxID=3015170 RepID=UPI0022DDF411|nr:glycosyltransferase [Zunongwangia sp. HRR-M8]WBL23199.1 glycosyltransferase [Zunongwangia sp. HRR-M8]